MQLFNVYSREFKEFIGNVLMHPTANESDVTRAVIKMVNRNGYKLQSAVDAEQYLIVDKG